MKATIWKARIKRNNLEAYAGSFFRDDASQIVIALNKEGKKALAGIQREDGIYTVIGEKSVLFSTISGANKEIPLAVFSEILHLNALEKRKSGAFEFLKINEQEEVWLHNELTMNSLWNLILWLEKHP